MKIATWNIERPTKTSTRLTSIGKYLQQLNADILILTETNDIVDPGKDYKSFHSSDLTDPYKEGERRTSIYTRYDLIEKLETFNEQTSICVKLNTPLGELAVYGTIIGIYGNREASFNTDLDLQIADFERIAQTTNLCIAGDLNITFTDNYYYTEAGRNKLIKAIEKLSLVTITDNIRNNIDHIILPQSFIREKRDMQIWNTDKKLSDHIGVLVTIA